VVQQVKQYYNKTQRWRNRRFILVEMDNNISQNITAERLKRVTQGYTYKDQKGNEKQEAV